MTVRGLATDKSGISWVRVNGQVAELTPENYFLKAFDGLADANRDAVVTGTELGAYLRPQVIQASNRRQNPLYGRLEGEGEILFPLESTFVD